MTVNVETPIASSVANGVTTVFPHSFTILDADDFVAVGVSGGVTTTYVNGVDYTLSGVGSATGSITFAVAPASGTIVTRYRDTALERTTDYQQAGDLLAAVVNRDFDRLWQALQDIYSGGKASPASLRVPNGETVDPFPDAATRASHYAGFDASGNPTLLLPASGTAAALATELADASSVANGDAKIAIKRTATGAVATTAHAWHEKQPINAIADFGCVADGVSDDTTALQNALTAAIAQKRALYIPGGTYLLTGVAGSDTYANGLLVPFGSITADPSDSVLIYGDAGLSRLKCNANNMVLLRIARNCVTVRDLVLDSNAKTGVILCGIVPESMTQTSTQVSQSYVNLENVDRIGAAGADGIVMQPGPQVGGSDSGCFYHNVVGGTTSFVGGGRHVYLKKNADWGTHPNRPTRVNFIGQRLVRGNAGYHFEVGSEININGGHEELIASDATPLATPTARHITADCTNINFFGGYSEGCTKSVALFANNVNSWGYIPASGSTVDWRTYASAFNDATDDVTSWTPVVNSSGGGAQGAATSTGKLSKHGKLVFFTAQISAAKGTLGAGNVTVSGLPFVADSAWTGADFEGIPVTKMDGITLGAGFVALVANISGATLNIKKMHGAGAGMGNLAVADCGATIIFTVQGWYKAV